MYFNMTKSIFFQLKLINGFVNDSSLPVGLLASGAFNFKASLFSRVSSSNFNFHAMKFSTVHFVPSNFFYNKIRDGK